MYLLRGPNRARRGLPPGASGWPRSCAHAPARARVHVLCAQSLAACVLCAWDSTPLLSLSTHGVEVLTIRIGDKICQFVSRAGTVRYNRLTFNVTT